MSGSAIPPARTGDTSRTVDTCTGSGSRVVLAPADASRKATTCEACGRSLSVRVGRKDGRAEATLPRHRLPEERRERDATARDAHAWAVPVGLPELVLAPLGGGLET